MSKCWQWGICVAAEDSQLTEDIRVFNNIVYENDRVGIGIENWGEDAKHRIKNIHIYNNTLLCNNPHIRSDDPWGCGIHVDAPDAENIFIYNNLIAFNNNRQIDVLSFSNSSPDPKNLVIDTNLVFFDVQLDSLTRPGTNHINKDPLLSDLDARDGRLNAASPALGAASRARYAPERDFYGNLRPGTGPFDIGAVEQ